jgi:hypothetical protein
MRWLLPILLMTVFASPTQARETLGIYRGWGAFRDPAPLRCFAIARPPKPLAGRNPNPFASIGFFPTQRAYGQFHARLRFNVRPDSAPTVTIDERRFPLMAKGSDVWAVDAAGDAAIIRAMRSGRSMSIEAVASTGQGFADSYRLRGAASAIDASSIGCAR